MHFSVETRPCDPWEKINFATGTCDYSGNSRENYPQASVLERD